MLVPKFPFTSLLTYLISCEWITVRISLRKLISFTLYQRLSFGIRVGLKGEIC